ncbi:MAG: M35 family metallo-endopeptidase [Telluria sp.]
MNSRYSAILLSLLCNATHAATPLSVSLSPLQPAFGRGEDVRLRVTVTNSSGAPQFLLRWQVPAEQIEAPLFEVQRDGVPVRYLGMRVKRAAPGPGDYVRLAPGAALTATVELSAVYDMQVSGTYTVRYRAASGALFAAAGLRPQAGELGSAPVSFAVTGRLPRGTSSVPFRAAQAEAGLSFNKCSNAQQEQLAMALEAGRAMTNDALVYLGAGKEYGARYATWFGAPDAGRGAQVTTQFTAIKDAFDNKPIKVDCGCDAPYFAYVYPAQPYTIWVCKAFWMAPVTGTDSRGGTLVHELSHFDVVAGTDDHVYGHQGAAELARTNPARAVNNADSHEYFGENSPPQR